VAQATAIPPPLELRLDRHVAGANAQRVRELIETAANAPSAGGSAANLRQKVGDYYASQMDTARIEALGLAPLSDELAAIAAIANAISSRRISDTRFARRWHQLADREHLRSLVSSRLPRPEHSVAHLVQGGLGLADRDDYLDAAPERPNCAAPIARTLPPS